MKRSVRPWDVAVLWLAAGGEPARSSSSIWQGQQLRADHAPRVRALKAQRPLGLCPGLGAPLRLQANRFFRYATCASSLRTRAASSSSRVGGTARTDPFGLPLGLGLSACAPPSRYSLHHCFNGVALAIPKCTIASGLLIPPSTTAAAAATLVS